MRSFCQHISTISLSFEDIGSRPSPYLFCVVSFSGPFAPLFDRPSLSDRMAVVELSSTGHCFYPLTILSDNSSQH